MRLALEESRDNYERLAAHTRATEEAMCKELARLNAVVERLGGEAAESRHEMLARIELLTTEREKTVSELTQRLADTELEMRTDKTRLTESLSKMRWLQQKAMDGGSVKTGRDRQHLYWESLKNSVTRDNPISWRTDKDDSQLSRVIAQEHKLEADKQESAAATRALLEEQNMFIPAGSPGASLSPRCW